MPSTIHPIVSQIVNRLHVSSTDIDVIRAIRNGLSEEGKRPDNREARKEFYRQGIVQNFRNRREYIYVMQRMDYRPKEGTNLKAWNDNYDDNWEV